MKNPVILSAVRTPIGKFLGTLATVPATKLGAIAVAEAVNRAGVKLGAIAVAEAVNRAGVAPDEVDEVIMGNVVGAGLGQNPARQAALGAELPDSIPAMTLNKVCGSGLKAVVLASQAIKCGDAEIVVAGGMESMSNALDSMIHDGLWDAYNDYHMGNTGEVVAERFDVSREQQDEWAAMSHERALAAIDAGKFVKEIVPVDVPQRKKDPIHFDTDEAPRRGTTAEVLGKLRPAFKKGGTVTAGNAPGVNDGGCALVVASAEKAAALGLKPRAEVVAYASSGMAPELVMMAPELAVRMIWEKTGWSADEVALYEFNEAFAVQQVALGKALGIDASKHNVVGGAVALGHPIGASGARILTTLIHALEDRGEEKGIAALCLGGGNAVALAVRII